MIHIDYGKEIWRKLIHLSSLWMPVVMYLLPRVWSIALFEIMLVGLLLIEITRHYSNPIARIFNAIFSPILRQKEAEGFTGAFFVLLAALMSVAIFPLYIAVATFSMTLVADTAAALVGRKYGKHKVLDKSWEGFGAFVITGMTVFGIVAFLLHQSWLFYLAGFVAIIGGAIIELFSTIIGLDDNVTVSFVAGNLLWIIWGLLQ